MEQAAAGSLPYVGEDAGATMQQEDTSFDNQQTEQTAQETAQETADPEVQVVDAERYKNLEQKLSAQGDEVGQLRQTTNQLAEQNRLLQEQLQNTENAAQVATSATPEFDARLLTIQEAVDSGDLSITQGMAQMATLAREQGKAEATQQAQAVMTEEFAKMENNKAVDQFKKDNADFDEVVASGALEAIKATNPIHDNVSAYYAYKASQLANATEQVGEQAYQKGMTDQEKLEAGKEVAAKTLSEPGTNAQQIPSSGTLSDNEVGASMLNTLKALRG